MKCLYCSYDTNDYSNMKKHIRRMHRMQNVKSDSGLSRPTENMLGDYMCQMNKTYDIRLKKTSNYLFLDLQDVERLCLYQNLLRI